MILAIIDFSKAFDFVWHPPFSTNLFRLASILALLVELDLSFLIGALAWFIKITKVVTFKSVEGFRKDPFLALYFSLFFINDLLASLPSSVSCSRYAHDLAIRSSCPSVPTTMEATQGALIRLERWSEYWCLPLNPSKSKVSFFSVDPHQAGLQPPTLLIQLPSSFQSHSNFFWGHLQPHSFLL